MWNGETNLFWRSFSLQVDMNHYSIKLMKRIVKIFSGKHPSLSFPQGKKRRANQNWFLNRRSLSGRSGKRYYRKGLWKIHRAKGVYRRKVILISYAQGNDEDITLFRRKTLKFIGRLESERMWTAGRKNLRLAFYRGEKNPSIEKKKRPNQVAHTSRNNQATPCLKTVRNTLWKKGGKVKAQEKGCVPIVQQRFLNVRGTPKLHL